MATISPHEAALIKHTVRWRHRIEGSLRRLGKPASRRLALCIVEGLVFLKMARQRNLQPADIHLSGDAKCVGGTLKDVFARANARYHSTLFEMPNGASPQFAQALRKVAQGVRSFRMGKIGPSILGHIYETDQDGSRKGVYFTPDFISEYIVSRTLAPLLRRKRLPQLLDPACGAGAFPLHAFEQIVKAQGCEKSLKQKLRIVRTSIHAVDIDPFAVELTRLSLLLKLYERTAPGENASVPDLSQNIRCTNALILSGPGSKPLRKPRGGFDAIIVNPPHIHIREQGARLQRHFARNYRCARGDYYLYVLFLERSLGLLRPGGRLGIIVQSAWATQESERPCRELLMSATRIESIADISPMCVRSNTKMYPHILICQKTPELTRHRVKILRPNSQSELKCGTVMATLQQRSQNFAHEFQVHCGGT